jgi:uroporphyrinogen decarboxylase
MMRQAGRYLPQYRAVRAKTTFLGLCKNPDLACEVTLQPIDEFGMDAAILFSDILIPLEAMGMKLEFTEDGPSLPEPLRDAASVERLVVPDPEDTMAFVPEAVRRIRAALAGRVPLIGFAGAPLTLAAYAVEGGGSAQYLNLKRMLFAEPALAHRLLERLAETVAVYLEAQVAAGAEALQLFDTWGGILAPADFDQLAARYAGQVIERLRASRTWAGGGGVPIIYYVNGGFPYLERMRATGADVIGLDWKMDIAAARQRLGDTPVQGNLDPTVLFASPEVIEERVRAILAAAGPRGHIFNLGHGVQPPTNPEHVRAMVQAVKRHGVTGHGA